MILCEVLRCMVIFFSLTFNDFGNSSQVLIFINDPQRYHLKKKINGEESEDHPNTKLEFFIPPLPPNQEPQLQNNDK